MVRAIRYVEEKCMWLYLKTKHNNILDIDVEGIYRVSGIKSSVEGIIKLYDEGKDPDLSTYDPYVITGMLKRYLTLVPEPIMTYNLYEPFLAAASSLLLFFSQFCTEVKDKAEKRKKIRDLVEQLPELNKRILAYIARHLKNVSDHKDENKMGPNNLAIVFGPSMFRTTDDSPIRMLTDAPLLSGCVQTFLLEYDYIFLGKEPEPIVPATPVAPTAPTDGSPHDKQSAIDKRKSRKSLDMSLVTNALNNNTATGEDPSDRANRRKNNRQGFKNMDNVLGVQKEQPPADLNQLMSELVQTAVTETVSVDDMASPRELSHKESWRKETVASEPLSSYITMDSDAMITEDKEDSMLRDFSYSTTATQHVVDLSAELAKIPYNFDSPMDAITQRLQFVRTTHKRTDDIAKLTHSELDDERKFLKQEIRSYEKAFAEAFSKDFSKQDKEKIRPIYKRYQLVKKLAEQSLLPSTPTKEDVGAEFFDDMVSPKSPLFEVLALQTTQHASPAKKPKHNTQNEVSPSTQRVAQSLRSAYSRKSVQLSNDPSSVNSNNNTSPVKQQETESEIHELKEKKKKLQRQIHQFQNEFEKEHGRKPNKQEKQQIQNLYDEYKSAKLKLEELCK